jgi:DNA invertase Pin-like site-specific DNA recombinase
MLYRKRGDTMAKQHLQALSYLRVSGKGQVRGDGFPRQRQAIASYAKAHHLEVIAEYRDEGVSGTTELEGRAGLAALLDHVESNGVRIVIIERADRLARDLMVSEVILAEFRRHGVSVIAADGTELTGANDDPTRKLIRQVLAAVAEFDKSVTVAKLRAARDRIRRRTGRCEGVRPYGSTPAEKAILKRMRLLYRKPRNGHRRSFGEIAAALNDEHLPARSGRSWSRSSVHAILTRPSA